MTPGQISLQFMSLKIIEFMLLEAMIPRTFTKNVSIMMLMQINGQVLQN